MNKKLMTMGLAALMLAGCSSDDLVTEEGQGVAQDKNAYVTLRLSLPSTSGSRADDFTNDNFDAGKEDEYAVKRLDVLFFSDNGGEKKLETYYTTSVPFGNDAYLKMPDGWSVPKDENVTTQVTLPALKVNSATEKTVVVLVNSEALGLTYNKGTDKLDDFKAQIFNSSAVTIGAVAGNTNGWLMSNAPVVVGSTIQPFTTSAAYTTEAEAKAKPVDVYLERAVGKVTVSCGTGANWTATDTYTIPGGAAYAGATIKFKKWDLDITNKSMYLFHQYEDGWTSGRYAGTGDPKRIYMAKDANYTKAYNGTNPNADAWHTVNHGGDEAAYIASKNARNLQMASNFKRFEDAADLAPGLTKAMGGDAYCFENTFTVQNMSQDQTTRVLLQAVYDPDGTGTGFTAGQTFYMVGESGTPLNEADFFTKVKNAVKLTPTQVGEGGTFTVDVSKVVAGSNGLAATASDGNVGVSYSGTALTTTQIDDAYKSLGKITVYKNGVCYYVARVKHFGSTYTPWGDETSAPEFGSPLTKYYDYFGTTDPLVENAYLGRYGIVRNNWYDLTLNTVSAPGSPVVPESGDVCDDVQNYYLQATIKILSWAKRSQSVDL